MSTFTNVKGWFEIKNVGRVFSEGALRLTVGLLGLLLPLSLVLYTIQYGNCEPDVLPSISDYFYSEGRDIFVGILSAVCLSFLVFQGYDNKDFVVGKVACIACFCIIIFPTKVDHPGDCHTTMCKVECLDDPNEIRESDSTCTCDAKAIINTNKNDFSLYHYIAAAIFFGCLVIFSWCLFPLSYSKQKWKEMTLRNQSRFVVYKYSGFGILSCMILAFIVANVKSLHNAYIELNPIFWLEVIMLFLFSLSWLTKSQIIFKDEEEPYRLMIAGD